MKPAVAVLYADASAAALVDALKTWRQEYAPSASYEGLVGLHLRKLETYTKIEGNGVAEVTVHVSSKHKGKDDTYYYEAGLVAGELRLLKITD